MVKLKKERIVQVVVSFHAQIPDAPGSDTYFLPSFPFSVLPQHLFAGYGGLDLDVYFFVVWIVHLVPLMRLCTLAQYLRSFA